MITNPSGKFHALIGLCVKKLETDMQNIAREQERLDEYKSKNPDKVLNINRWQELLNSRADFNEYMTECLQEHFPVLMEAEAKRRFLKGRESVLDEKSGHVSLYRNHNHKEAERHYSIARQRLIDNI